MKIKNPKNQSTDEIIASLLQNTHKQYTESAHAEIFNRLIHTITDFNDKAGRTERVMLILAVAQVILALAQIYVALK
jgi:hypothetical protein